MKKSIFLIISLFTIFSLFSESIYDAKSERDRGHYTSSLKIYSTLCDQLKRTNSSDYKMVKLEFYSLVYDIAKDMVNYKIFYIRDITAKDIISYLISNKHLKDIPVADDPVWGKILPGKYLPPSQKIYFDDMGLEMNFIDTVAISIGDLKKLTSKDKMSSYLPTSALWDENSNAIFFTYNSLETAKIGFNDFLFSLNKKLEGQQCLLELLELTPRDINSNSWKYILIATSVADLRILVPTKMNGGINYLTKQTEIDEIRINNYTIFREIWNCSLPGIK